MCAWCHVSGEVPTGVTMMSEDGVIPLPTLVGEKKFYTAIFMGGDLLRLTPIIMASICC